MKQRKSLSMLQLRFVEAYKACGNIAQSAREAGYSPKKNDSKRIMESPAVKAAIDEHRRAVIESKKYGYDKAMDECDKGIQFAIETENANAYSKLVELKAKLSGLLIERHEVKQVPFVIEISGIDVTPKQISAKNEDDEQSNTSL